MTPAVADSREELEARILDSEADYRLQPRPIRWRFTSEKFDRRLEELQRCTSQLAA